MVALKNQHIKTETNIPGITGKEQSAGAIPGLHTDFDDMNTVFIINEMIENGDAPGDIISEFLKLISQNFTNTNLLFLSANKDKSLSIISPGEKETTLKNESPEGKPLVEFLTTLKNIQKPFIYKPHDSGLILSFPGKTIRSLLIKRVNSSRLNYGYLIYANKNRHEWTTHEIENINHTGIVIKNVFVLLQQQQMEEAMKSIENQYQTLYHTMKRGVVFQDKHGKIFDANPAAEKILGLSATGLIGMTLTDNIWNSTNLTGEKINPDEHICTQALKKQKEVKDIIISIQNQDTGKKKWISVSSYPQFDLISKNLIRLFTVFDDITQHKQLIDELQASDDKYRKLVDNALAGVYQTTLDGDIIYVNQAAARMFEYGTQLNLTRANILFRYANQSDREKLLDELKKNDGKIENFEVSLKTKNNNIIDVIVNGVLKDGIISGMIIDITGMKKASAELKLNEERLESLLKLYEFKGDNDEDISGFALDEAVKITASNVGYLHFINEDQKTIRLNTWSTETLKACDAAKDSHYPIDKAGIWVESFYKRKPVIHNDYKNNPDKKGYPDGHIHLKRHMSVPVFDGKNIVAIAGVGNKKEPYTEGDVRQFSLFMNSLWGILKRNRAEKALKESEEIYRSFVQNFQGIAFRLNPDWSPVFFHGYVEKLTGYTEQDFLSQQPDWFDIVHPDDLKNIISNYPSEVFLTPDFTAERKYRIIRKDGEVRWVHDVVHNRFDESGNPMYINGVVLDITASKQTEEEFETLFNISSDLICVASLDGYFLKINPAFNKLLGYSDKELKSYPYVDFIVTEDKQKTLDIINEELRLGKTVINFQNRYRCKDGSIIWLDWNSRAIPELNMTFAVARDITNQKQSEEELIRMMQELERSNRDLEEFAYVASHDLQEPLRNIKGFTGLFAEKYKDQIDDTADKYINYIIDGTNRMQKLISDLLSLSRITTKGKAFELTNIGECIQKAMENIELQIKENNAKISFENMPELIADGTQIVQLFQNLLSNAVKFRKKDIEPVISVEVKDKTNYWQFRVKDNGIGMDMKFADRIFIIFQRLHTRKEYPGTGIGLALCKKIVERHGGKIKVKSVPGEGSVFKFTLRKR